MDTRHTQSTNKKKEICISLQHLQKNTREVDFLFIDKDESFLS